MTSAGMGGPLANWFHSHVVRPDETLLWAGRPGVLRSMLFNFWYFPIGVFLCALLFMIWWKSEEPGDIRLPEIALIAGSLWLLTGPLRYGWRAWQSAYFLTNERAVLLRKGFFRLHQTEYTADQITDYHIRRRPYDRGDIRLRLSRSAAANPYQDDKMKWLPEKSRTLVSWSGSAPFALYSDGLWGIDTLSGAVAAIDRMKRDALLPRR